MDWQYFEHHCPGTELVTKEETSDCYYDSVPDFVAENGYLPVECRECYKGLIFWSLSPANAEQFKKMLKSLPISIHGKYNEGVVVFYFGNRGTMLEFLDKLKEKMEEFDVEGRIQWRVSGRYWQDEYPEFFESTKALRPVRVKKELSMKTWLVKKEFAIKPRERKDER